MAHAHRHCIGRRVGVNEDLGESGCGVPGGVTDRELAGVVVMSYWDATELPKVETQFRSYDWEF